MPREPIILRAGEGQDVRLGRIHPGNQNLTVEFAAKTALRISPDETPRWG